MQTVFIASGFMYTMNQIQGDKVLENLICDITRKNLPPAVWQPTTSSSIVYYDGLGQIGRGLTYIYLRALVHLGFHVKYIHNMITP